MSPSEILQTPRGHRKPAPMLAVSGAIEYVDTRRTPETRANTGGVHVSAYLEGLLTRACARTRESVFYVDTVDTRTLPATMRVPGVHVGVHVDPTRGHHPMTEKKPMRALMPQTAALIDAFRTVGLTDNTTLAEGIKDGRFWAREAGHVVGTPGEIPAGLPLSQIVTDSNTPRRK